MNQTKKLKAFIKKESEKKPEKYFPIDTLKELGFKRHRCKKCHKYFWSLNEEKFCGEPNCSGGFTFLDKKISNKSLSYTDVWKVFAKMHKKLGYSPIERYPVVSRWNPTMDFTIASVAAFQPFVVSGEVKPPANPLVIPQFCLRFSDVDSVGLSSAHFSGFVMLGEHAFMSPKKYNPNQYLKDHLVWLNEGMGLKNKDLKIHEDAWGGGENFGNCLEFFSGGLEVSNQVYMKYYNEGNKLRNLNINVLDMGQGQERAAWFTQGKSTAYDTTFPDVMDKLRKITGVKISKDLQKKFLPYSSYLNIDEVKDVEKTWSSIARKVGLRKEELQKKIFPMAALYSVAEHSRSLLVALNDGALPSNVGGGYNLRMIFRRALGFIDKYGWELELSDVCGWQANSLNKLFPELKKNLEDVRKILDVEKNKYEVTKNKAKNIVAKIVKDKVSDRALLKLYDSQGISPEIVAEEALKVRRRIKVPEDFYTKVAELHENKEKKVVTKKEIVLDLSGVPDTKILYFDDCKKLKFRAKVVKVLGEFVILDKTYFYPTSGGQLNDKGAIAGEEVVDVFKQGNIVVHMLRGKHDFPFGEEVECVIDEDRRLQLMQHHTSAHIVNAAAKKVLGNHVNQTGAFKDIEKARLDISHYQSLTDEEVKNIEKEANKIISNKIPVYKKFMSRTDAEKTYGMGIYQGGVPIGKELRIVAIPNVDVEACGGTHVDNTFEIGLIKILKSSKISDSVVRLEYVAGKAASQEMDKEKILLADCASILKVDKEMVPERAREVFQVWKAVVKKGKNIPIEFKSAGRDKLRDKELLEKTAMILKTQPEHVPNTLRRFLKELKNYSK